MSSEQIVYQTGEWGLHQEPKWNGCLILLVVWGLGSRCVVHSRLLIFTLEIIKVKVSKSSFLARG